MEMAMPNETKRGENCSNYLGIRSRLGASVPHRRFDGSNDAVVRDCLLNCLARV